MCRPVNDFNPLPRKEGDVESFECDLFSNNISIHSLVKRETVVFFRGVDRTFISIHSLVKRETAHLLASVQIEGISIHSLVKRETCLRKICLRFVCNFNPLPRKEGDCTPIKPTFSTIISIHSLVKRETYTDDGYSGTNFISIHSLVKRETRFSACIFVRSAISIHSLVKRETWLLRCWFVNNINFNPLPRKEGDMIVVAAASP